MVLCDYAAVADGKLYMSGAGWDTTGPGQTTHAVGLLLGIPWDRANTAIKIRVVLIDADGNEVEIQTPLGEQKFVFEGNLEVGRPPGATQGADLHVPLAVPVGPLSLPPGRYRWDLSINDEHDPQWELAFTMRGTSGP